MSNTVKRKARQKYKTIVINLPKEREDEIRSKISDDFRSYQEVFDTFVISGIVLRNARVLDLIDQKLPEYIKEKNEEVLKRLNGEKSQKEYFKISCTILPNDKQALDNYCVDKGYKKAELFHIIFSDLIFETDEKLCSFVDDMRNRDVIKKKKEITKLYEEEYIEVLDEKTKLNLLSSFTEKLDKGEFAPHLMEIIHERIFGMTAQEKEEEDEIDRILNEKIRKKKLSNTHKISRIIDDAAEEKRKA